jgi:hypothetical protein
MLRTTIILASLWLAASCGDDATPGVDAGRTDDGGTRDGGRDSGVTDAGDTDGGDLDAGDTDGGDADGGADAAMTDAGEGGGTVVLSEFVAYANCMPIVAPDPIITWWTASISDGVGPTARLTSAELTITGAHTLTQELTVDAPVITLSGGTGSAMQRKVLGMPNPATSPCGELCGGATATIEVVFDIGGTPVTASATGSFSCVH